MAQITQTFTAFTSFPAVPNPAEPSSFETRAFAFTQFVAGTHNNELNTLVGKLNDFATETNAVRDEVNTLKGEAEQFKNEAKASADIAAALANYQGEFNSNNTYSKTQSVTSGSKLYMSKVDNNTQPLSDVNSWIELLSADTVNNLIDSIMTPTPTLSGSTTGVETTKVNITISNYSPTATYNINVSGGVANRVNNIIEWTLPVVDATGSYDLTVSAIEVGKVGSAIATHSVNVTNAVSDQVVLFQNATISATDFPTLSNIDLANNILKATADNASATSYKIEQDVGDGDFIMATPTVENKANLLTIEDGATNTSVTVKGELTEGDTVLVNDGESTTLNKFDTTGKTTVNGADGNLNISTIRANPIMTSNTAPTGTASASAEATPAWKAFDGSIGTTVVGWLVTKTAKDWLQYEFDEAVAINKYTLQAQGNALTRSPTAWTIQASNTGAFSGEEVILDSVSFTNWTSSAESFAFNNSVAYKYYRIVITSNAGDVSTGIVEWIMIEAPLSYTLDITSLGLTNAPKIVARDTADIETSLVPSGGSDSFEARNKVGHIVDNLVNYEADGSKNTSVTDAVPTMTDYTSPSGLAFGNYTSGSTYQPFYAFDDAGSGETIHSGFFSNNTPKYVGYKFEETKIINKYSVIGHLSNTDNQASWATTWQLQGSNDTTDGTDGTWDNIGDLISGQTLQLGTKNYYSVNNDTAYLAYRLYDSTAGNFFIGEIEFIEAENIGVQKITTLFDSDNRQGRDFKVKVNLAKSGDEVSKIEIPISKV